MATPLISVIINTYNYGRFVEDAIDSALAQDYPADQMEVLVVDDGSTDDTAERVKKYGDRVRYFYKENGDQCSAIPFGVARAKGDLLAFLDGDDVWLPNKLSRVVKEFAASPPTVMVYHKYVFWDTRDNSVWTPDYFTEVSGDVLADRRKLLKYINTPTSSLVFRRQAFQRLTNIPSGRAFMYDFFLTTAVLFLGPVSCVPEVLTKNRVHGSNCWAAGQDGPDLQILRRRVARREAAIEIILDWIWANAPKSLRRQARILHRQWRVHQDSEQFLLKAPTRIREFVHLCRHAMVDAPVSSRAHLAYRWTNAIGFLIVGRHVHYLEGVRTRIRKLRGRLAATEPTTQGAGRAQ